MAKPRKPTQPRSESSEEEEPLSLDDDDFGLSEEPIEDDAEKTPVPAAVVKQPPQPGPVSAVSAQPVSSMFRSAHVPATPLQAQPVVESMVRVTPRKTISRFRFGPKWYSITEGKDVDLPRAVAARLKEIGCA